MVARVAPGPTDARELAAVLRRLIEHPDLRAGMGAAARARMDAVAVADATARGYASAIDETLALVRDPVRRAMSRWSGALVDIGTSEAAVREGYGLSYARAFEDFTRSS
jgi:MoxR-like ATPase